MGLAQSQMLGRGHAAGWRGVGNAYFIAQPDRGETHTAICRGSILACDSLPAKGRMGSLSRSGALESVRAPVRATLGPERKRQRKAAGTLDR